MNLITSILALIVFASFAKASGELHFPRLEMKVSVPADKDEIAVSFPFSNQSSQPVKLGRLKPDCECTTAAYEGNKKILQPGEPSTIVATIKTGNFTGKIRKGISFQAEGSTYKVTILADIPEIIQLSPHQLAWEQGSALTPQTITITLAPSCPMKLKEVNMSGKGFDFSPVTVKPGKVYRVVITPKSTEKPIFESLWILTDSPLQRYSKTVSFVSVNPAQ